MRTVVSEDLYIRTPYKRRNQDLPGREEKKNEYTRKKKHLDPTLKAPMGSSLVCVKAKEGGKPASN